MILLFLPILGSSHTVPRIWCPSKSNGNLGYLQYVVQDDENSNDQVKSTTYTSFRHSGNKYDFNWIAGSICPRTTGSYNIRANGYPAIVASFNAGDVKTSLGDKCSGEKNIRWNSQYLYANRCYPFAVADWTNCLFGVNLNGYINDVLIDNSSAIITNCYTTDCIKGYATDTCSVWNDAYCNGNGEPDWGRSSNGIGCTCRSHGTNLFCEDTSINAFTEQGVSSLFIIDDTIVDTVISTNFNTAPIDMIYGTYQIKARLFVPQNTYLEFLFTSNQDAQLFIDNKFICGASTLQDMFHCSAKSSQTYYSSKTYYKRGTHEILVKMNVGCSMFDRELSVKWKFYRWYSNDPKDFEEIPDRYLGTV